MSSLKRHEGYLLIDLSNAPPVPDSIIPDKYSSLRGLGRSLKKEMGVNTCIHCHAQVILNPERTRDREYCRRCDHYICDSPVCIAMKHSEGPHSLNAIMDEIREENVLATQSAVDPTARIIIP
jgi:hypothetical protein